jgi:hypothetical protein
MPDYRHLSAETARGKIGTEFKSIYAAVFSEPPYNEGPEAADEFVDRMHSEITEPGFDCVEARAGRTLVGFTYGYTYPAGRWWDDADRPPPHEVTAGPTFAVIEWAVLHDHRGNGIGRALLADLLTGRPEPYATLMVNPAANARDIYTRWGWRHVGSTRSEPTLAIDLMLLQLTHA